MIFAALGRRLNKPYFVFRPQQVVRRLRCALPGGRGSEAFAEVTLPWGDTLRFLRQEQTGLGILRRGLFDLTVSETLFRLADPGELAVDVGGNVGHMTSVLSRRVGAGGVVLTFEPHPVIYEYLATNVERWVTRGDAPDIVLHRVALSNFDGSAELAMGPDSTGTRARRPSANSATSAAGPRRSRFAASTTSSATATWEL